MIFLALSLGLASCGNNGNDPSQEDRKDGYSEKPASPEDSLFHEVMEGHDSAMAKMGKLSGAIKAVRLRRDSLVRVGARSGNSDLITATNLEKELTLSETAMNDWMEHFNVDSATDNEAVRLKYLESEIGKVNKVKDQMFSALGKADSLLKK